MKVGAASAIKLAWLVVDFDGTCTVRDTTPTIACLAAAHNNGGVEQLSSFGVHERDYMEGHSRLLGGGELEAEPSAAVDVAALSAFLAALDDHSTRTTREVSRSGVLAGLDGARVAETFTAWAAGEVVGQLAPQPPPSLQPGCAAARIPYATATFTPVRKPGSSPSVGRAPAGAASRRSRRLAANTRTASSSAPFHRRSLRSIDSVTKIFVRVFGYSDSKARKLMMEVHKTGRSIVWTGAREQAEMYAQKLQSHHLLTTLEKVED